MTASDQIANTRIWWDGGEVAFVRWTEKSLVFTWCDVTETAIQLPRGAVLRLLEKGVLEIEGYMPDWTLHAKRRVQFNTQQLTQPVYLGANPPRMAAQQQKVSRSRSAGPRSAEDQHQDEQDKANRLSIVTRLIRKLTGGGSREAADAAS